MTLFIFLLGLITVILSVSIAIVFSRHHEEMQDSPSKRLTKALTWQLLGEAIIGIGTLIFAMAAHFGWLPNWSIATQSTLRFIMFFATSATTLHLFLTIKRIAGDK